MSIYKSSNHSPSLEEVDLNEDNTFSCVVNTSGEPVKAYKITILSEDGSETIADGYLDTTGEYKENATNLLIPVGNKKTLKIPKIKSSFHATGKSFENGKNYQWGIRTYNATINSEDQPNTKICEGYLVGSTKYITWVNIPPVTTPEGKRTDEEKARQKTIDQLVYDRYIEFTANSADELIIGAHESKDKEKPKTDDYPYIQRRKIDWVTKDLGTEKDYIKIETEDAFDYDYYDGKDFNIYKCSSDHTVTSAFADPNTNINVSDYVILYDSVADAKKAFDAGDDPSQNNSGVIPFGTSRKIIGYSSDTGEIRVNDAWNSAPNNTCAYRIFEYDTLAESYKEYFTSDIVFQAKVGATYYALSAPVGTAYYNPTAAAGTSYYKEDNTAKAVGTLSTVTACTLNGYHTLGGSTTAVMCSDISITTYGADDGTQLYDNTVGKVDYFSDPALQNKVGTLTAESTSCVYISEIVSSIYDSTKTVNYYVATPTTLGTLSTTGETPQDKDVVCAKVTDTYSTISFKRLKKDSTTEYETKTGYIKTSDMTSTTNYYIVPSTSAGALTEEKSYTFNSTKYSTVKVGTKSYQVVTIPGGVVGESDIFVANNVDGDGGTITVNNATYQVALADLMCLLDDETLENPFEAQVIGGRPITSTYFKVVSNRWDDNWGESNVHRLFVQPNINIKSDVTNPDELVFTNNKTRVNILYKSKENSTTKNIVDITFNKLDNTQWMLEYSKDDEEHAVQGGGTVPIIPQTDYVVYTDFADSSPYNVFYAREAPIITLQFRNAMKELHSGVISDDHKSFYDSDGTEISKRDSYLYYEVTEDKYYNWVETNSSGTEGSFIQVPSLLIEGYYNEGHFYKESSYTTQYDDNENWLYYDVNKIAYYLYSDTTKEYTVTDNTDVVWVNVKSSMLRDYREVEFKALWQTTYQNEEGKTVTKTMSDPQIKNYIYSIYAYDSTYSNIDLIKTSQTYYDIDPVWTFRGLDGTPDSTYTITNPHKYRVSLLITDEYDKQYTTEQDFNIYYPTENSAVSINVSYLCDEQANLVNVSPPSYAESTDYGDYVTVTGDDLDTINGMVTIATDSNGNSQTLNYTQTTNDLPLTFPKSFSALTKLKLTENFVENNSGNDQTEVFRICHSLDNTVTTISVGAVFYYSKLDVTKESIPYYKNKECKDEDYAGELTTTRPYILRIDTSGETESVYGQFNLEGQSTIYYVKGSNITYATLSEEIDTKNYSQLTITLSNSAYYTATLSSDITTPTTKQELKAGEYYVLNNDNVVTVEDNEVFVYKVDVSGAYYTEQEGSTTKVIKNKDCYHLTLWRGNTDTEESEWEQVQGCFYIGSSTEPQDSINLMNPDSPESAIISVLNAVQYNSGDEKRYTIETALTTPTASLMTTKHILISTSTLDGVTYSPGVYRVVQSGNLYAWEQVLTEEYLYLTNTNEYDISKEASSTYETLNIAGTLLQPKILEGTKSSDNVEWTYTNEEGEKETVKLKEVDAIKNISTKLYLFYETTEKKYYYWDGSALTVEENNPVKTDGEGNIIGGKINYYDDNTTDSSNYVWLDNGGTLSAFKSYIRNKLITIFLTVDYSSGASDPVVKSQILLENNSN